VKVNPTDQDILNIIGRSDGAVQQWKIVKVLTAFCSEDYVYSRLRQMEARNLIVKTGPEYSKRSVILTDAGRDLLQQIRQEAA
jgi:DNA-binding HxlR family transcriptional regulator